MKLRAYVVAIQIAAAVYVSDARERAVLSNRSFFVTNFVSIASKLCQISSLFQKQAGKNPLFLTGTDIALSLM